MPPHGSSTADTKAQRLSLALFGLEPEFRNRTIKLIPPFKRLPPSVYLHPGPINLPPSTGQSDYVIFHNILNQNNLSGRPRSRFWDPGKHDISLSRFADNYPQLLHTRYRHKNGKASGVSRRQSGFLTVPPKSKKSVHFACEAAGPDINGSESIDYRDTLHGGTALKSK
jgi:hypothetical protein